MESEIVRLFKVNSTLQTHEITDHRLQKNKVVSSILHVLLYSKFLHQEKKRKYLT